MARIFPKTQAVLRHSLKSSQPLVPLTLNRHRSSKPEFVEVCVYSSSSSAATLDGGAESIKKRLDDMIHRLIVEKSTPDWLPFVPGSSFWVPPSRRLQSDTAADSLNKMAYRTTEEELLSFATSRGWPCSTIFIHDSMNEDSSDVAEEEEGKVHVEVTLC